MDTGIEMAREILDEILTGCLASPYHLEVVGELVIYSEYIGEGDSRVLKVFHTGETDALLGVYQHYLKHVKGMQQFFISKRLGFLSEKFQCAG